MKHFPHSAATALLLACAACTSAPPEKAKQAVAPDAKILENFTLIDGTGKDAVPNAAIVIQAGRIKYAGPKAGAPAVEGAEKVDLTGKYVMPGIINLHGHLGNVKGMVQDPSNYTPENLNAQLQTYSNYGVTTVMSMGSDQELILKVREEQRSTGRPSVSRVYTAFRGFTGKAGYPTSAPGMKGVPFEVEKDEDVEKAIQILVDRKVDLVKIWVDDHLGKEQKIPFALSKKIIELAHKNGLKVAAHIFYLDDAKKLVAAGLDGLAHSVRDKPVDDELIKLMKEKGAWQMAATITREVSTFYFGKPSPLLEDPFFTKGLMDGVLSTLKDPAFQAKQAGTHDAKVFPAFTETAKKNLKKLVDAGVNYGFGTDTGPPLRFSGFYEHWEMELMAEAGLTPQQIIQSFSKNNAEFLKAGKDLGTIEAGHWADLVVLAKNPLDDIKNTRTLETVMIAGTKVNR